MQIRFRHLMLSWILLVSLLAASCAPVGTSPQQGAGSTEASGEEAVTIEYWQYNFGARVTAMDQLIAQFEAENPNIKVIHNSDIPYDAL